MAATPPAIGARHPRLRRSAKASLRYLATLGVAAAVLAVIGVVVLYSGVYDVSAKNPHSKAVSAVLNEAMVRSVRAHARGLTPPHDMDFEDPVLLAKGAAHYDAMCRMCHGAPGKEAAPWDLHPPAPDLVEALDEENWSDPEVFWIIKNGIKDTGMPGFDRSHDDHDLWTLAAVIRKLSTISPDEYDAMVKRGKAASGERH